MAVRLPAAQLMLWREGYRTRVAEGLERPPLLGRSLAGEPFALERGALVMGFAIDSFRQRGLWERLIAGEFAEALPFANGIALAAWSAESHAAIEAMTPASARATTFRWDDADGLWKTLAAPRSAQETLAAVVDEDTIRLALMGPPTEEALDAFVSALRKL